MSHTNTFKIIVVGDAKVGKTSFIDRHLKGHFQNKYVGTIGTELHPLEFKTPKGYVTLNIWDCAGEKEYRNLLNGYYLGADGAILMFDVQNPESYANIKYWYKTVRNTCPDIPIVICGNKVDLPNRSVKPYMIKIQEQNDVMYYDISTKSNYNLEKPFAHLLRKVTGTPEDAFIFEE